MSAAEIQAKIDELLKIADQAARDLNQRVSALQRAEVWIKYYAVQASIES